jgi:hypothetical protein
MASKHIYRTTLETYTDGSELANIGLTIRFSYIAGSADHYNKSIGTWLPGDADELEITDIALSRSVNGRLQNLECPQWLSDIIAEKIDHDSLREVVAGDHAEAMDARDEARAEARAS